MQLSSPDTLPQLSRCTERCVRCIVSVVLLGKPLIYHGESRLVPAEAVDLHWVDAAVYQPLHNLERDAEQ